jgi:hypothetical protein
MANGSTVRLLPLEIEASAEPSTDARTPIELEIGEAVASAVTGLCYSLTEYWQRGRLLPETRDLEASRLARVVELQLAHERGDFDFKVVAHTQAAPLLHHAFDASFFQRFGVGDRDKALAFYIDEMLAIASKVVAIERELAN